MLGLSVGVVAAPGTIGIVNAAGRLIASVRPGERVFALIPPVEGGGGTARTVQWQIDGANLLGETAFSILAPGTGILSFTGTDDAGNVVVSAKGVQIREPGVAIVITPGTAPDLSGVGIVRDGETFSAISGRFPTYTATVTGGSTTNATWTLISDGGSPVTAGDHIIEAIPTFTSVYGTVLVGDSIPLDITVAAPVRVIVTTQPTTAGLTGLTTAMTGQQALDAWTGRPVAAMSDGSELTTIYEVKADGVALSNLAALLPETDALTIATIFSGYVIETGATVGEIVATEPVAVTLAAGQATITGTTPDLPDPVFAGTPYFTQLGRIVAGSYTASNGSTIAVSDTRLRSGGVAVPYENRFNLVAIGEELVPVETVAADGATTIDVAGVSRTAIAATITETVAASVGPLNVDMDEAAVLLQISVGAANANNGRTVTGTPTALLNGGAFNGAILKGGDTVTLGVRREATGATTVNVDLGTVTIASAATGTTATTASFDGASVNLSRSTTVGTYADGSPWIVSGGTAVGISGAAPAYSTASRTVSDGTTTTTPFHGIMVDPGKAPSGTTLAQRQAVNDGEENGAFLNDQGYDGFVKPANNPYNASANVDSGKTGVPLSLIEGTVVKAVSITSSLPSNGRPAVEKLVPFTVVKTAPAVNAFRPGHSDPSKVFWLTTNALDMTKIPNIAAGTLPIVPFATALGWCKQFATWQHTYNVLARNISPRANDAPVYGGDNWKYTESLLSLCYDTWTADQKRQIATALVQLAIDITTRAEQGAVWQDNGGHCAGQKSLVAFAAHVTGHQRFKDALGFTTTFAVWNGGTSSIWGEDRQFFRITQTDVNRAKPYKFTSGQIGLPEWSGDATRKDPADPENYLNSLGVLVPGVEAGSGDLKQHYRHIIARVNVPGVLALRLMGAASLMQSTFLNYQDRHMTAHYAAIAAGKESLPNGENNKLKPLTIAAWQRDRDTAGTGTGELSPPEDETVVLPQDAVIDPTSPALIGSIGQSDHAFANNEGNTYNKQTFPVLAPSVNFTVYGAPGTGVNAGAAYKRKLANGMGTSGPNIALYFVADALDYATGRVGKPFAMLELDEAGTEIMSLVDDSRVATGDRRWSNIVPIYDLFKDDYPQGIQRLSAFWSSALSKYKKGLLESHSPALFGVYQDGTKYNLSDPITGQLPPSLDYSYKADHVIYDLSGSGRGFFENTVAFDMSRDPVYSDMPGTSGPETRAGMIEFRDSDQFKSLGGSYAFVVFDGHGDVLSYDGTVAAAYAFWMPSFLRAAGFRIEESNFDTATLSADGTQVRIELLPQNGGELMSRNLYDGTPGTTKISQPASGFEIDPDGTGRYPICKIGSAGIPAAYQGTVEKIGPTTVLYTTATPLPNGSKLAFMKGSQKSDLYGYIELHKASPRDMLSEKVTRFLNPDSPYPYLGPQIRAFEDEFVLQRGVTVKTTGPKVVGGVTTPPPSAGAPTLTTAPVLSGTPQEGQTLTVTAGAFTGSPTSYSRQLTRNGSPLGSAQTGLTFVVPAGLTAGDLLRVETTATNASGSSAPSISNALTYVATGGVTPATYFTTVSTGPTFVSSSTIPSATGIITYEATLWWPSSITSGIGRLFRQAADGCDIEIYGLADGARMKINSIEDSSTAKIHTVGSDLLQLIPFNTWVQIKIVVDLVAKTVLSQVTGLADITQPLLNNTGTFQGSRKMEFNGYENNTSFSIPAGVRIGRLAGYLGTSTTPFLGPIEGDAATVNAHARKVAASGNAV